MKIECYFEVLERVTGARRESRNRKSSTWRNSAIHIMLCSMPGYSVTICRVVHVCVCVWAWAADSNWPVIFYWNGYEWKDVTLIYSISFSFAFFFSLVLRLCCFASFLLGIFSVIWLSARAQEHAFTFSYICLCGWLFSAGLFFSLTSVRCWNLKIILRSSSLYTFCIPVVECECVCAHLATVGRRAGIIAIQPSIKMNCMIIFAAHGRIKCGR